MSSTTRITGSLAAAALIAAPAGCVLDEASSLHRDSTVEVSAITGPPSCEAAGYPGAVELTMSVANSRTVTHETGLAITLETDGTYFDFSASPGIDAVIAVGASSATVYRYVPPALGDARLVLEGERAGGLERVTFCRVAIGCTLAAGYWRAHSERGPSGFDETWTQLPDGADTRFFLSDQTYFDVLSRGPADNAYYRLAQALISAKLSQLAGADADAVADAIADATEIFEAYTPEEIAELPPGSELRVALIELAGLLDDYVSGHLGPGHCDDLGEGDALDR